MLTRHVMSKKALKIVLPTILTSTISVLICWLLFVTSADSIDECNHFRLDFFDYFMIFTISFISCGTTQYLIITKDITANKFIRHLLTLSMLLFFHLVTIEIIVLIARRTLDFSSIMLLTGLSLGILLLLVNFVLDKIYFTKNFGLKNTAGNSKQK